MRISRGHSGLIFGVLWVLALACCGGGDSSVNPPGAPVPTDVVQPLPLPGPYAVACSNIVQDFDRVGAGEDVQSYWEGKPSETGIPRYATDLLADPLHTLTVTVTAPDDPNLYGEFAGRQVEFVVLACYPTAAGNPRPDYPLPTGKVIPHMQTGSDAPLFADAAARFPVIAFSHGYSGSPISNDYISGLSVFASYGYVVIAPFHGDPRFSNLKVESFTDAIVLLSHFSNFTAMQALRPLSVSASLDLLLSHPQWQGHIDAARIGGFGASMGGETMILLGGAGLTTSVDGSWDPVTSDPRIKAAVGYVPYFGQPFLPAFGRDQHGLDVVALSFLGISGTADTTAPISLTEAGMSRLAGTRELVALMGVEHGFDIASTDDIFTWMLMFLDAEVLGNPETKKQLLTMGSVAGGGDDRVVISYNGLPMM